MEYIKNNPDKKEEIFIFVNKYKENGLKTFLTMEYGEGNVDKLLTLDEKGNEAENVLLFKQFTEIINRAEAINKRLNQLMVQIGNRDFFDKKIFENLIRQGNNYLMAAVDLKEKGQAIVYLNGQFIQVKEIFVINLLMEQIKIDMDKFLDTTNNWEIFKKQGLSIIDKYLFDTATINQIKQTPISISYINMGIEERKYYESLVLSMDKSTVTSVLYLDSNPFNEIKTNKEPPFWKETSWTKMIDAYNKSVPDYILCGSDHSSGITLDEMELLDYWAYEINSWPGSILKQIEHDKKQGKDTTELEKNYKDAQKLLLKPIYIYI